MRLPDFFIVGAPKSGTSALRHFLAQCPDVFIPETEPAFFGADLRRRRAPRTIADYAGLFAGRPERLLGDKSVLYLFSARAAGEIRDVCPEARILVVLRHPVDMMRSWHAELLWSSNEDIVDFAAALEAEPARTEGRLIPPAAATLDGTRYRAIARYGGQLERYFEAFGRDRVLVLIFEEMIADAGSAYRAAAGFIGADADFTPEFGVVNPAKSVRSRAVARAGANLVRRVGPRLGMYRLPARVRRGLSRVYGAAVRVNTRPSPPAPIDLELRARLDEEFAPEIVRVEELLGRAVPAWRR